MNPWLIKVWYKLVLLPFSDNSRTPDCFSSIFFPSNLHAQLSCIFLFLLLFYKVNIHIYIPPVLYFICYSLFLNLQASFWDHFLPEGHPLRLAAPCDDSENCVLWYSQKYEWSWNTEPSIVSFPYKKGRFLSKDSCLHLCQYSHSPAWSHLILTDGLKTYFEELWHRPSHAVMITRPNSSLQNSRDFIFFWRGCKWDAYHSIFSLTLASADCLMTSSKIQSICNDTWFCWLSDDLLQDTGIYKILSSLAMTCKLLLSDPLKPNMKINFILWGRYELHDCFPIYRWTENKTKNTDKALTSCHGEEYYSQEDNPRFDQALSSYCFRGVSVRQVELKSVIQVHIVGDQVMS